MESTRLDVLVVDDEPALREVLSLRIEDWGHEVRAVGDAVECERELDRRRPDIVLCDVVLPGRSGLELLKRVKRQDERLPVVMMTAHGNIDAAVEAMKAGATDFLTKPLDYAMLYALLEATASDVRQRRAASRSSVALERQTPAAAWSARAASMREIQRTIEVLASSDASAIITGESGTGKEVVARAVHALSARRDKPFIADQRGGDPRRLDRERDLRPRAGRVHRRDARASRRASSWRTAARSSSTRSPRCRSRCSRSCCAFSRTAVPAGSAAASEVAVRRARPRGDESLDPRRRPRRARCARTCTIA